MISTSSVIIIAIFSALTFFIAMAHEHDIKKLKERMILLERKVDGHNNAIIQIQCKSTVHVVPNLEFDRYSS